MLPEYHRAVDRLQMYREGGTYPLRIGSLPLAEEYGFANAFSSYWARNTSVQIDYFERSQEDLIDKLDRHKIDLALPRVDMLDPDRYSYVPLVLDPPSTRSRPENMWDWQNFATRSSSFWRRNPT